MALVYISLGTNLGEKERNLSEAILELSLRVGAVICQSRFYEFEPWGFESENSFLNAVILMEIHLSPFELLTKSQEIEKELGRTAKTTQTYSDRIIDIDILLYDNLIIDHPTLKIPHPKMLERDFVLIPLVEIAPDLVHPASGKKYSELIANC
jgi:2-amino-4-hydroxy-6-hydroxymethyldihydropteridine diphosphokinase